MGFFGKIFSKKEQKPVQLHLAEVEQFFSNEVSGLDKQLQVDVAGKLAEVKHLLRELQSGLDHLSKSPIEAQNKKLQKIVETAKKNAERQLNSLIEKLQPPSTTDPIAIRQYSSNASSLLRREIQQFGKNIAYTSISFKSEIKQLGSTVKQLQDAFSSMQQMFSKAKPVFLLETIRAEVKRLEGKKAAIESLERELGKIQKGLSKAKEQVQQTEQNLVELKGSKQFKEIAELNGRKAALLREKQDAKSKTIDLFSKIDKPLNRLQKAAAAGKYVLPKELFVFLQAVITNPFNALKKDPKAVRLKQLLRETEKAIGRGVIELKEKEREKRLGALQEMLSFDFFGQIFWKFNSLDAELAALEKKLQQLPAGQKESELLRELSSAKKQAEEAAEELREKEAMLEDLQQQLSELKQKLQDSLQDATNRVIALEL